MNKKIILFLAIFLALSIGAFVFLYPKFYYNHNQNGGSAELKKSYSTLKEYAASINYSCDTDSDCEIKDVRNCCGYSPECVNLNAKVDPDFVNEACGEESMGSVCGFPSIDACKCVNSKCQGYLSAEKINNLENSQLIEIAKQYALKKPQLYWNREKFVEWDNYSEMGADFAQASPEWIISQKVSVKYIEPNKYEAPYDDLNDKYMVSWFFIPGCEENPTENIAKPNWFDKLGRQCMGGYSLSIIINPDGTVNRAELNAYN